MFSPKIIAHSKKAKIDQIEGSTNLISYSDLIQTENNFNNVQVNGDDLAVIMYTSGLYTRSLTSNAHFCVEFAKKKHFRVVFTLVKAPLIEYITCSIP